MYGKKKHLTTVVTLNTEVCAMLRMKTIIMKGPPSKDRLLMFLMTPGLWSAQAPA